MGQQWSKWVTVTAGKKQYLQPIICDLFPLVVTLYMQAWLIS